MRIVFHHIPKTGGGTLVHAFKAAFGEQAISYNSGDTLLVTTHLPFEMCDYPARAHITIVRDPIERLVSWVRYKRATVSEAGTLARDLPVAEFLRSDDVTVQHCARDRMVRQLGGNFYTDPISMGDALERAKTRLGQMWWVGRTETLDTDMGTLFGMLGMEVPTVDRWNVSTDPIDLTGEDHQVLRELTVFDRHLIDELALP